MVKAILHAEGLKINLRYFEYSVGKHADESGLPYGEGSLLNVVVAIEATKDNTWFEYAIANHRSISKMVIELQPAILGQRSRYINMYDCHILNYKTSFSSDSDQPLTEAFRISAQGMEQSHSSTVYSTPFRKTFDSENTSTNTATENSPSIQQVQWINPETQEDNISEISYSQKASIVATFNNVGNGESVMVTIEKEDGTEFEKGATQLKFSEVVVDGIIELTPLEIKEQWENFKTSDADKLIAKVEHAGNTKRSASLKLIPKPKVIAYFRPNDKWKGEFGFDWLRIGDTKLFGDNKYEDIVSKQYKDSAHTQLEKNGNVYKGYFKKDPLQFKDLKKKYNSFSLPWATTDAKGNKTPEDYLIPWMSMYKNQEAKVKLILDIQEKGDYLEFENNTNFTITPKTINISGKKGSVKPKNEVTIKCLQEFAKDETITIHACQKDAKGNVTKIEAGKITLWANDATKQKEKKVVFVQIKTPEIRKGYGAKKGKAIVEKSRIEKYLKQALIKLHKDSDIVDLDLSTNKDFLNFIKSNKVSSKNTKDNSSLDKFLAKQLSNTFKKKYDNHFKAFYFAENGYHSSGGLLSGYSRFGVDFVVVFATANDQTAAHEFLHSMNLAHSFSNSEASKHAAFTYQYKKTENLLDYTHHVSGHKNDRCSLWYWQWVKANNSIK